MTYQFGGMLYRNSEEMHAAIAEAWITAEGANPEDYILESFATATDQELAGEAIAAWNLPDADPAELAAAFADLRRAGYGLE